MMIQRIVSCWPRCSSRGGEDALSLAQRETPDLVIVDLRMPGMDGVELIRRLRSDPGIASVKILVHTATAGDALMDDFLAAEAVNGAIPKPCEPAEVLRIVGAALAS